MTAQAVWYWIPTRLNKKIDDKKRHDDITMKMETNMRLEFRIIRILEDNLIASDCILDALIDIAPEQPPSMVKNSIRAIKIWAENYLHGCVAFGVGTDINTGTLETISNNIMMCPDDPHDYLLLSLIHSKISALGKDRVNIVRSSLTTDTGEGFSNTISGNAGEWLPSMEEWLGPRSFHQEPWWLRADSSSIDLKPEDDDDLSIKPTLGLSIDEMIAKFSMASDGTETAPGQSQTEAEIIKPVFKPRIITTDD